MSSTTMIQVESIGVETFLSRLDELLEGKVKSVITALGLQPQQLVVSSDDDLLSRQEVKEMFGISFTTLNEWGKAKILNPYKIGRRVYYKRGEVKAALVAKNPTR
jgi:hypothetical protein